MQLDLPPDDAVLTLEEFVAHVDRADYELNDYESLIDIAIYLKRLSNNRVFLTDFLFQELVDLPTMQSKNVYGPTVIMLYACPRYFIRANVWKPISMLEASIGGFLYDICHDHNFDILTIGHAGPGYTARTYEYDLAEVQGVPGERINLVPCGDLVLKQGRVVLYRAKRDVHIQMPPEKLSISINFIPRNRWIDEPQFQFNEESGAISRYIHSSGSELMIRMAGLLADEASAGMFERIRTTNASAHVRALAAVALSKVAPEAENRIRRWLEQPGRAAERSIFELELSAPGACLRPFGAPQPRSI